MKRHDLHNEDGWVLMTAIILMTMMISLALASFAFVDSSQRHTLQQRQRETSLNVTEGALYSQGFALAQKWPGNAAAGANLPDTCTQTAQAAAAQAFCPTPGTLAAANGSPATANFANVDALANVTWTTRIRDNGAPNLAAAFVSGAPADATQTGTNVVTGASYTCPGPCKWDANGDRQMWVQSRGIVRGRPRNVVALLKREKFGEGFLRNGVVAGSFQTSNNGNKTIIDASGSQVVVRCTAADATCTQYEGGKKEQVLPAEIVSDTAYPAAMTAAQRARFKSAAQTAAAPAGAPATQLGTYYTDCPSTYTGAVVYIDVPASKVCSDANNGVYNTAASPGIIIMPRGRMDDIKGTYYGLIYLANLPDGAESGPPYATSGPVLTFGANSQVIGGVAIDGPGRLVVGQASGNSATIDFSDAAFDSLATFGTTGLVQNTWRELPPS
jgi:predicted secreted protein